MLSLKAFLLLSVSCLAHLAAAGPLEHAQMESRNLICAVSGIKKGTDGTHPGDACTTCNSDCHTVAGQPPCC
ncbi:hypothetical protein MCOR29_005768 [Pyricularia oryzae]|uniref:Uncharacterized protein n=5 Tax=Pyricularia TaxID=48558 RepID=A0ABQ8NEJ9_PYRGI|nr:hypothetical protein MCOR01_002767 [Pyricularia oryzae]KAI6295662.1 hypothetical protein MCOR33_007520 [Pyricularia grisea]KAI6282180.1 hypothetical protein MCOR26_002946 [Pyricularia oryzae]KAI6306842.1 hypothetical protein MCOR34_007856 [Pyricularia oryzae]KAI6318954.1 hypothetical protein MCOR29_005768 [Pyricularia oryzae]